MGLWQAGWLVLALLGLGLEGAALLNKDRGDTLSEIIWRLKLPFRIAIAVGLLWVGIHFIIMRWIF